MRWSPRLGVGEAVRRGASTRSTLPAPCPSVGNPARALLATAAALGALVSPWRAEAIFIDPNVTRVDQRTSAEDPFTVSFADCVEDNSFDFTVSTVKVGDTLSVWATVSANCTDLKTRNDGLCTRLVEPFQLSDIALTLTISATAMAATLDNVVDCVDSGATDSPRPIKLYFLINESEDPVAESSTYDTYVDLLGPVAPTAVSVGVGDQDKLTVSYTATTSSTDAQGFEFYCEQSGAPVATGGSGSGGAATGGGSAGAAGGAGGAGGSVGAAGGAGGAFGGMGGTALGGGGAGATAGSTGVGGTGATGAGASGTGASTGAGGGDCTAPTLVPGELPPAALTSCGNTTSLTDGVASGLALGVEYAVGVAGYDKVGNVGKLSQLACGAPEPVDDFFEIYRKGGGEAGGGYCGHCAAPGTGRQGAFGVGLGLVVGLGLLGRRGRRGTGRRPS